MERLIKFLKKKKKTFDQQGFTKVLKTWSKPAKGGQLLFTGAAIQKKNLEKIAKRYKGQGYLVLPKTSSGGLDYRQMAIKLRTPKISQGKAVKQDKQ